MRRSTLAVALSATLILGLTACGSDDSPLDIGKAANTVADDGGSSDDTASGGDLGTIPAGVGVDENCRDVYNKWIAAMGATSTDNPNLGDVFNELATMMPDDLKDDAALLGDAYGKFYEILAKYDGDMTKAMADPDAQAAIAALNDENVSKASDNISNYFASQCPG